MLALGHEQNREVGDWKDRTAQNRMRKERKEKRKRGGAGNRGRGHWDYEGGKLVSSGQAPQMTLKSS